MRRSQMAEIFNRFNDMWSYARAESLKKAVEVESEEEDGSNSDSSDSESSGKEDTVGVFPPHAPPSPMSILDPAMQSFNDATQPSAFPFRTVDPASLFEGSVAIRGRKNLGSSDSELLPESIGAPQSGQFLTGLVANDPTCSLENYAKAANLALNGPEGLLMKHGAVLLRGIPMGDAKEFQRFCELLGWPALVLGGGGTERSNLTTSVRTASNEPGTHTIEPHLDMAHNPEYPNRIAFFMLHGPPAGAGGETVLTDMRGVTRDLASDASGVAAEFEARGGVAYHKKLWSQEHVDHSFTWQSRYFTDDKAEAEKKIRELGPSVTRVGWETTKTADTLVYENVEPAVHTHPVTGERLWFNGVHTNHRSYYELAPHIDTSDGAPMDTSYADGAPIADETIAAVRGAWWRNSVAMTLQTGDLVIVDNLLAGHGRMPWAPGATRKMTLVHFA